MWATFVSYYTEWATETSYICVDRRFPATQFYPSHLCARAVHDGLPADFLVAREVVGGLYYARKNLFDFFIYIHHVYSACMTTDFMIVYNRDNPPQRVENLLLSPKRVHELFSLCLYETPCAEMPNDDNPTIPRVIFEFIIKGFIRVMTKDR